MKIKALICGLALLTGGVATAGIQQPVAQDAPVEAKTYTVKKGDSFYGICYKLGVTSEALLAANPGIATGVKVGQVLTIPSEALRREVAGEIDRQEEQRVISTQPVRPVIVPIGQVAGDDEADDMADVSDRKIGTVNNEKEAGIVVMLPFMLRREEADKRALNALDFYKGLLMAADSLGRGPKVTIVAMDTENSPERVRELCRTEKFRNSAIVIAPDDSGQMEIIAQSALDNDLYVLNAFSVRDSSYLHNPRMLQSYIPSDRMLAKAAARAVDLYGTATPVILRRSGGRDDKADFVEQLLAAYQARGIAPLTIEYSEALSSDDLARLPEGGDYLLVPTSGTLAEFNKFSAAVLEAREDALGGSNYTLWGYPDWTAFRGANEEMLHRLDATIYTRFYVDPASEEVKQLEQKYNADFGGVMHDAVPVPALLGFDIGQMLLDNLHRNQSEYRPTEEAFYGKQSSFSFVRADSDDPDSGYYNDALYIIHFIPDGIERL